MTATSMPKISIVTPSFNQGAYLEDALRSVLDQHYPNLEYLVLDGGSTDGSREIIERYADRLAYWTSERDRGQYDAINRGLQQSSGEIMAWLNSDDKYLPWTFEVVAEVFSRFPEVEWITSAHPLQWNNRGQAVRCGTRLGYDAHSFFRGANLPLRPWFARAWIQQESTFWRRSLWERAGGEINISYQYAGDFDLWARFFRHGELYVVSALLGGMRKHGVQKTVQHLDKYLTEAEHALRTHQGRPYGRTESMLRRQATRFFGNSNFTRVPEPLRRRLARMHVLSLVRQCRWNGNNWELATRYII